jgi:putative ABC transport system substrate-binding protein
MLLVHQNTGPGGTSSPQPKVQQQEILRLLEQHDATPVAAGASGSKSRNPDLILAIENHVVLDIKAETATIPIVAAVADPVAFGIVPNLARPGGNITGVSAVLDISIWSKRVELLREAAPKAFRMALLASHYAWQSPMGAVNREATGRMGVTLIGPPVDAPYHEWSAAGCSQSWPVMA